MRKLQQMIITGAVFGGVALSGMSTAQAGGMSPDESLKDLMSGNVSFQRSETLAKRRAAVAQSQAPQAIVVSCSDSRVPPEAVFNRYVGRLFIVRTAGHALGDYEMASIEYAVEHLHTPLLIVLGHERCGAIKATVDALTAGGGGGDAHGDGHAAPAGKHHRAEVTSASNAGACAGKHGGHDDGHDDAHEAPAPKTKAKAEPEPAKAAPPAPAHGGGAHDHIGALVENLKKPVQLALDDKPKDPVDAAVHENVLWAADRLVKESGVIREAVSKGTLKIVPAYYDLDTGAVEVLE
jgi:carbonic anhydrase